MTTQQGVDVLTVILNEEGLSEIYTRADKVSDPRSEHYGQYCDRAELSRLTAPPEHGRHTALSWFESKGMRVHEGPSPQLFQVEATAAQLETAFGPEYYDWLRSAANGASPRGSWGLPMDIGGFIKAIHLHQVNSPGEIALLTHGISSSNPDDLMDDADRAPEAREQKIPADLGGFSVADIRDIYGFPAEWDGEGETIGLLNLAGDPDIDDLQAFWRANGIERDNPVTIAIGGQRPTTHGFLAKLEATMGAAWIGALAPKAQLVIYNIDTSQVADPWSTMLHAAANDTANQPSVLVSTWTTPAEDYFRVQGMRVFADAMRQASLLGITVVAASGDWGVCDGRPGLVRDSRHVVAAAWPQTVFPAVEDLVLSVGGSMITHRNPLTELAWSGPLPPSRALRRVIPFRLFATSGGFSRDIPQPAWQRSLVSVTGPPYSRGTNIPAVTPFGRGYPDVAIAAAGPSVQRLATSPLSLTGYQLVVEGKWIDYAGGTSISAPVWAAIVACLNQARRKRGMPRVGFINPLLYDMALRPMDREDDKPFRDVVGGNSDVIVWAVFADGEAQSFRLAGYDSRPGWDPVTGLGVPRVDRLIDMATRTTSTP